MLERRCDFSISRMSIPSIFTRPLNGGYSPCSSFVNVVLPEPDRPTMPSEPPGGISSEKSRMASGRSAR